LTEVKDRLVPNASAFYTLGTEVVPLLVAALDADRAEAPLSRVRLTAAATVSVLYNPRRLLALAELSA
jgi:hypothetical protein